MAVISDPGIRAWQKLLLLTALLFGIWLIFSPATQYGASPLDDPVNVLENPNLTDTLLTSLPGIWSRPYQGLYIPVTYTVWAAIKSLSRILGGEKDFLIFCHLINIIFHMINVLLVIRLGEGFSGSRSAALFAGLIFAFHPVQVEPVVWITGLKDLLSTSFALITILLLSRFWQSDDHDAPPRQSLEKISCVLSVITLTAAVLSKPSAAVVPVILLVMAGVRRRSLSPREIVPLLPHFAVAGIITGFTMILQPAENIRVHITALQRIPLALNTLGFYLKQLVWPAALAPVYGRTVDQISSGSGYYLLAAIPVMLALVLICVKPWRRFLGAFLVFIAWLLPVSGILTFGYMQVSMTADRYMYPALMGAVLIGSIQFSRLKINGKFLNTLLILIWCSIALYPTFRQVRLWRSPEMIFHHALQINSRNSLTHKILGEIEFRKNNTDAALDHYRNAIAHDPGDLESYNELGNIFLSMEKPENAEYWYRQALNLNPESWQSAVNLGNALMALNRFREAETQYLYALEIRSDLYEAYSNLGLIYRQISSGDDAVEMFVKAHELDPGAWEPLNNLGNVYYRTGDIDRAIAFYSQALSNHRDAFEIHCNLANSYMDRSEFEVAISYYRSALDLNPEYYPARINLAICLETRGDPGGAIREYQRISDQFRNSGATNPVTGLSEKILQLRMQSDQAISDSE